MPTAFTSGILASSFAVKQPVHESAYSTIMITLVTVELCELLNQGTHDTIACTQLPCSQLDMGTVQLTKVHGTLKTL